MIGFILGQKSDQSQSFDDLGIRIPTTFIKTSPCYLIDVKMRQKHGYSALMLGFGKAKKIQKTVTGQLTKAGIKTPLRFLREFRILDEKNISVSETESKRMLSIGDLKLEIGQEVKPEVFFKKGDLISVSGISKGKGFQGVVKRHHFKGGSRTHGQSDRERAPGSIGQTTTPGRIYKGKRMAGRMGGQRVTVQNLKVVEVKPDGLTVAGLIPGVSGGLVEVAKLN